MRRTIEPRFGDAVLRGAQLIQRGAHGAATRVSEHDDEARAEILDSELDAADLRLRRNVPRHTNHKQVAEPRVEHDLRRHTRIGTAQDRRERRLPRHEIAAIRGGRHEAALTFAGNVAGVAVLQAHKSVCRGSHLA